MNLTRDVTTQYGTFARGTELWMVETNAIFYAEDGTIFWAMSIGTDRHPVVCPFPAEAFVRQERTV